MTTVVTPILTQLELDRDRFKKLVNGTDTDTVTLEGRTERSIANMVKYRLDNLTTSLADAVNQAESAASSADSVKSSVDAAETRINQVEQSVTDMATDVTNLFNQTEDVANEAQTLKTGIDQVYADLTTIEQNINTTYGNVQTTADTVSSIYGQADSLYNNEILAALSQAQSYVTEAEQAVADYYALNIEPAVTQAQGYASDAQGYVTEAEQAVADYYTLNIEPALTQAQSYVTEAEQAVADYYALNIEPALTQAQGYASDAQSHSVEAEAAVNDAYINMIVPAVNDAVTASNSAQTYATDAQEALATVTSMITLPTLEMAKPVQLYPVDGHIMGSDLVFVASTPFSFTKRAVFNSRDFEIAEVDNSTSPPTYTTKRTSSGTGMALALGDISATGEWVLDGSVVYAWRVKDTYIREDDPYATVFELEFSPWEEFTISSAGSAVSRPSITAPSADTSLSFSVSSTSFNSTDGTEGHAYTEWAILDNKRNTIHKHRTNVDVTDWTIPEGILAVGNDYELTCRYLGDQGNESAWATPIGFSTSIATTMSAYRTRSIETTGDIDVETATVFRVDGTATTTLNLVGTLQADQATDITVFVTGAGGSISWPSDVNWADLTEPALGNNWTRVSLFWSGTIWVGNVVGKA